MNDHVCIHDSCNRDSHMVGNITTVEVSEWGWKGSWDEGMVDDSSWD